MNKREGLIAAHVDGVGELTPDERREVETWLAANPAAQREADATRAMIDRLRALPAPPDVTEPVWSELEAKIRAAVRERPLAARHRARWLVPAFALATGSAAVWLWMRGGHQPVPPATTPIAHAPAHKSPPPELRAAPTTPTGDAVVLDGEVVELDDVDPTTVADDFLTDDMAAADAPADPAGAPADPAGAPAPTAGYDVHEANEGLMPSSDLDWIDDLDPNAIERLDGFLKGSKG